MIVERRRKRKVLSGWQKEGAVVIMAEERSKGAEVDNAWESKKRRSCDDGAGNKVNER